MQQCIRLDAGVEIKERHEGPRKVVGNRSEIGRRVGDVADEVDGCSTAQDTELTKPRQTAARRIAKGCRKQVVEWRCRRRGSTGAAPSRTTS